jgi:hypothetical protein
LPFSGALALPASGLAWLVAVAAAGATSAARARTLAGTFGVTGFSGQERLWMALQMRSVATLRDSNLLTGVRPGMVF